MVKIFSAIKDWREMNMLNPWLADTELMAVAIANGLSGDASVYLWYQWSNINASYVVSGY